MSTLNNSFFIPRQELEDRVSFSFTPDLVGYDSIVPLREVVSIHHMAFMQHSQLEALIRSIPLRSVSLDKTFPYKCSRIQIFEIEPKGLSIGQTFVLTPKLLNIMSHLHSIFDGYVTKGISKMLPTQIYGATALGTRVMAFYLPPLIEQHNGGYTLLMVFIVVIFVLQPVHLLLWLRLIGLVFLYRLIQLVGKT